MRNLALAAIVAFFGFFAFGNDAEAGQNCVREATGACVAVGRAAVRPAYNGPLARTTDPMACLRILVDPKLTAIALIKGARLQGPVIKTIGANSGHVVMDRSRGFAVKEFCFERELIAGLSAITICNGHTPGQGNHHILRGRWLAALQRHGHAGDYLTLLGTKSYAPGIGDVYTERLYTQQYGFRL